MRIGVVIFDYEEHPSYEIYQKLHDVFVASCKKHMPDVPVDTIRIEVPKEHGNRAVHLWCNTAKLRAWDEYIQAVDDDVILSDADMLCIRPGCHAFDLPFDIAYTMRTRIMKRLGMSILTINGGIVMVRNSAAGKSWIHELTQVNEQMWEHKEFHDQWVNKYPGMNQTAMGYMLNASRHEAELHEYRTRQWNAVDCDWHLIDEETVFVHIKSQLRLAVKRNSGPGALAKIVKRWYDTYYEINNCGDDGKKRGYLFEEMPGKRHRVRKSGANYRYRKL